jgi:hypothetical protein
MAVAASPSSEAPIASVSPRVKAIMDPFYIPNDGYSALADAMDAGRS